ncbi:Ctr copper transporter family-domain-containing protein [Entophlyctis helioformis]|nr:Ctr copper transporter family-domain-containing protein [Entophlyctis helioformis]
MIREMSRTTLAAFARTTLAVVAVAAALPPAGLVAAQQTGLADPATAQASLSQLCAAPTTQRLVACSLRSTCKSPSADTSCSDANLLATACQSDAAVAGGAAACSPVAATCGAAGTAPTSPLCASVPGLPSTLETQQRIFNVCKAMRMEGCDACPAPASNTTVSNCNVMAVYAQLCKAMPEMSNCAPYNKFCAQSPLPAALAPYCPAGSSSSSDGLGSAIEDVPLMQMYFHTGIQDYVLFKSFVPRSTGQYAGAWLLAFGLSVLYFAIGAFRKSRLDVHHAYRLSLVPASEFSQPGQPSGESGDIQDLKSKAASTAALVTAANKTWDVRVEVYQLEKSLLTMVEALVSYLMMLIVMTFNVGLVIGVLVGIFVGSYVFDRSVRLDNAPATHCP